MSTIDWAKLTAPVPQEDIEWVEKAAGRKFAYMSAQFVRRRLDAILPGGWSYECEHVAFVEGQPPASDGEPFVVKGTLILWSEGSSVITRESFGSGKNFKEAETDAFKRAAQRLGIGNELYEMGPGYTANTATVLAAADKRHAAQHPAVARAEAAVKAVEAVRAEERPAQIVRPASTGDELACPTCAGRMWDNRVDKKNPRSPDWKCRDKSCGGVFWKDADGRKEPVAVGGSDDFEDFKAKLDSTDDLPFRRG